LPPRFISPFKAKKEAAVKWIPEEQQHYSKISEILAVAEHLIEIYVVVPKVKILCRSCGMREDSWNDTRQSIIILISEKNKEQKVDVSFKKWIDSTIYTNRRGNWQFDSLLCNFHTCLETLLLLLGALPRIGTRACCFFYYLSLF